MPALDAGIHALLFQAIYPLADKGFPWMAGSSPAMTSQAVHAVERSKALWPLTQIPQAKMVFIAPENVIQQPEFVTGAEPAEQWLWPAIGIP